VRKNQIKVGSNVIFNAINDDGQPDEGAELNDQTATVLKLNSKKGPVKRHQVQFQTKSGKVKMHAKAVELLLAS